MGCLAVCLPEPCCVELLSCGPAAAVLAAAVAGQAGCGRRASSAGAAALVMLCCRCMLISCCKHGVAAAHCSALQHVHGFRTGAAAGPVIHPCMYWWWWRVLLGSSPASAL
jgi:hypothetical protein